MVTALAFVVRLGTEATLGRNKTMVSALVVVRLGTEATLAVFVCGSLWRRNRAKLAFKVLDLLETGNNFIRSQAAFIQLRHQLDLFHRELVVLVSFSGHFGLN